MDTQKLILDKIAGVLNVTDKTQAQKLKDLVDGAGRIFVGGAGRSGLVSRFFAMRQTAQFLCAWCILTRR